MFSGESSRVIHEMGNMELFELGQISKTAQCHSCLKHLPEGLKFCACGVCLRPDEDTINRIKARSTEILNGNKSNRRQERSTETQQPSLDLE